MKFFRVLLTGVLLISCVEITSCQDVKKGGGQLTIEGLKKEYAFGDTISFELKNKSTVSIFYLVSLQKLMDTKWREVVPDITTDRLTKATKLASLDSLKSERLKWHPFLTSQGYLKGIRGEKGEKNAKFRFLVQWWQSFEDIQKKDKINRYSSPSFILQLQ